MNRSLAGLLFGVAFACACVAVSGYALDRTAFTPSGSADDTFAVLGDTDLQRELVNAITAATATQMYPADPAAAAVITDNIQLVASTRAGAAIMAPIVRDAHARLIGDRDDPVVVSPELLVQITRDERASQLPPLTLAVPEVGSLATTSGVLGWLAPGAAIAAVVFFVLCVAARPERGALVRTLGLGLMVLAASIVLVDYVLPRFVPSLLNDSPWAHIPVRLAADALPLLLAAALVLAAGGLVLFVMSNRMGPRRRWSTPVSTYRYREERRWS